MNWEAIGAIGEMLSALAVLVTLAYVAAQLRHSQREMRRATAERFLEEGRELVMAQMGNERLAKVVLEYRLALGGELPPFARELVAQHGATPEEAMLLFQNQLAAWLHRQRVIEHVDDLTESNRVYFDGILRRAYSDPLARRWYETQKASLEQHAVAYVDRILARSGSA